MQGYLLDTNMLAYWFDEERREHEKVVDRIDALGPSAPLGISAISLGETEYGHRCVSDADTAVQFAFRRFVNARVPRVLTIQRSTSTYYGQIRARLFNKFAPRNGKKRLRPCQLVDPLTAKCLGIQENDLWIAAQAYESNLVLVTHDKMDRLREVTSDLLAFEDWAE
ncbi:MAG: PIN domain-containing protein [Planctomycetia bacterium]|nr:PIN domain-containing protein [Planctomycetia bacterium]